MKAYIKPATLAYVIEAQRMMAASNDTYSFTISGETATDGYADTRRRGPWDSTLWGNMNGED